MIWYRIGIVAVLNMVLYFCSGIHELSRGTGTGSGTVDEEGPKRAVYSDGNVRSAVGVLKEIKGYLIT